MPFMSNFWQVPIDVHLGLGRHDDPFLQHPSDANSMAGVWRQLGRLGDDGMGRSGGRPNFELGRGPPHLGPTDGEAMRCADRLDFASILKHLFSDWHDAHSM